MSRAGFTLFDTAIGACGIAWRDAAVVGFLLPEASALATRARPIRLWPDAVESATPPAFVCEAIDGVVRLLCGERVDLNHIVVQFDGLSAFEQQVLKVARTIPPGETLTYGEIADRLGEPGSARAVGAALGRNPIPVIVPCHRVLAADGKAGGFSAPGGLATKARLLSIEGARTSDAPLLFDALPVTMKPKR
jgi:methylated-DNA-[protein]-cysteine S-methyltransferase